jgi:hypothetical protein
VKTVEVFYFFVSLTYEILGAMNLVEAIWTWYSPGGSSELEQKNVARSL